MSKVALVTDNSSDISQDLAQKEGVKLLFCPETWPEGEKIEGENIYEKMRKAETFPKTAAVSTGDYKKAFEELLETNKEVLCITPSVKISGCVNSAKLAKSVLPDFSQRRVFILDSKNGAGGHGLLVLKAASLAKEGKGAKEIIEVLENKYIPNTFVVGILESMKWIEAGGRISHGLAALSEQLIKLKIHPIIGIQGGEGKIKPVGVKLGVSSFSKALFDFYKSKIKKEDQKEKFDFFISYTDNFSEAENLKNLLEDNPQTGNIYLGKLNTTVGSHTGPGTLFLSWRIV